MGEDHPTEAACLLEQGASYRRRIGLKPRATSGDPIFAGFKPGAFSLYFGDAPIYHFDLEGRWQRAFLGGTHYLKGLDSTVHAIDRVREGPNLVLKRRTLADAEAGEVDDRVRSTALELSASLGTDALRRNEPASPKAQPLEAKDLRAFLEQIGSWDSAAWLAHCERYQRTYGPLPFLPPECQNAVVLQATVGHAAGIAFGGASAHEPRSRTAAEFAQHAKDVAALWGQRLRQSRVLFLAGSDVLHQSVESIAALLTATGQTFPIEPRMRGGVRDRADDEVKPRFDGVHVFLDKFASPRPDRAGWRELAACGLVRISIGVESGDPDVRRIYQKSWVDEGLRETISECKSAGLGVSVLTLVGAGGVERAESHIEQTARLVESLELGAGDFVFLLDENEIWRADFSPAGLTPLQRSAWLEQQVKLKDGLAPLKKKGVKVLPYTMEKQWT
jgi:hypothetical protein